MTEENTRRLLKEFKKTVIAQCDPMNKWTPEEEETYTTELKEFGSIARFALTTKGRKDKKQTREKLWTI